METKLQYVYVDPVHGIERYRQRTQTDSLGWIEWTSLEQSKFAQLEGSHTAHGRYEPQGLSNSCLHQVSTLNTLARREHLGETNLVHLNLHLARFHDQLRYSLRLSDMHVWLEMLPSDSGERFLFDYFLEQGTPSARAARVCVHDSNRACRQTAHQADMHLIHGLHLSLSPIVGSFPSRNAGHRAAGQLRQLRRGASSQLGRQCGPVSQNSTGPRPVRDRLGALHG